MRWETATAKRGVVLRIWMPLLCAVLLLLSTDSVTGRRQYATQRKSASHKRYALSTNRDMRDSYERVFPLNRMAVPWTAVDFESYSRIIISGPQRSGTTYFARALAKKLNYVWIDELDETPNMTKADGSELILPIWESQEGAEFDISNKLRLFEATEPFVAQRPVWSNILHKLPVDKQTLVVFMARNCLDVFESQNRIYTGQDHNKGWTCEFGRTKEWNNYHVDPLLSDGVDMRAMICTIKQQAFLRNQLPIMQKNGANVVALSYASLKTFSHFTAKEARESLASKAVAGFEEM